MVGNFPRFKSWRKFASSLGLTPKESSSGQRRWLGSTSKAGDPYLRTLLIGGARSMLLGAHRTKRPHRLQAWALEVEKRRGRNRAAVTVANKLARTSGPSRHEACPSNRGSIFRTLKTPLLPETNERAQTRQGLPARRTRKMRQMSSVRPTRGQADNSAGRKRPLFSDWLPVCGFHPGPEPTLAPTKEAVDTCAVATHPHHHRARSDAASTPTTESLCFLRRRKSETAPT